MKQTAIEKISKWYLSSQGHIDKYPIPQHSEVIFLKSTNKEDFGVVHLRKGHTKNNQVEDGNQNSKNLVGSETRSIENVHNIRLHTIVIQYTVIIVS